MDLEQLEILETPEIDNVFESNAIKFNKFKHTYFKNFINKNETYLDFLKMGSRHFNFQLPENIDEIFLRKESAPFFWLLESALLNASEKSFIENLSGNQQFVRAEIKKNFTKWVIAAEPSQKKIFAAFVLKEFKNSSSSITFIDLIYYSLILIFEESLRNPHKAIEELIKAQILVDDCSLSAETKKELIYLIQLYKSFAFLSVGNNEDAATELSYAINLKDSGIIARFYFAYLSAVQKRQDFTKALIKEILKYDLDRLNYAIDNSNIIAVNFFLNNPVFPNICHYFEFAPFTDYIQQELFENQLDRKRIIQSLVPRLNQLRKYDFDEYSTEETRKTIKFLYELNEQHANNLSIFLSLAANNVNEKFHFILNEIHSKIKEKFFGNYNRVMDLYQKSIEDSENISNQFKHEVDDIKSSLQKKLTSQIQQIEEYVKDELWEVEERKKNLPYQSSFDPAVSFRNSMSYNVVVSIAVFIIGGIAGYFNNSDYFESDFYLMLSRVILTGVKWSSLTFVIGFFISALISGLVLFDRSNEKQKLEKRTIELQKQKEMSIDMLKKEAEQKQKALSEGYLERIESHKRKIEDTKRERDRQEPILIAEAEEQLAPFTEKLNPLYLI